MFFDFGFIFVAHWWQRPWRREKNGINFFEHGQMLALITASIAAGLDPADVAARVLSAIRDDELYVFTHPDMRGHVDARFAAIQAAMDEVTAG